MATVSENPDQSPSIITLEDLCNNEPINYDVISKLLQSPHTDVNAHTSNGMTPLMQAAFKGNKQLSELLLAHGASVNAMSRPAYYTPLMFAAVSGHFDMCHYLLTNGAKTSLTNSIDKTASQLSSFVGQKQCAHLIEEFFSLEELLETAEKYSLTTEITTSLYSILLSSNIHPVRTLISISADLRFLVHSEKIVFLLEELVETKFKQTREKLSLRFYMIQSLFKAMSSSVHQPDIDSFKETCDAFIRKFLKVTPPQEAKNGIPLQVGLDNHLRQIIRIFPHKEMPLYKQLLVCIKSMETDSSLTVQASSPILHIISSMIKGPMTTTMQECATCGSQSEQLKRCLNCKNILYCNKDCQKLHWFVHKKYCNINNNNSSSNNNNNNNSSCSCSSSGNISKSSCCENLKDESSSDLIVNLEQLEI